ncbi:DUF6575 domain-containing protein [Picosynechococcus sp. PCC 73109]|uniref:DUF6575 domain-containing protein n=1 Tax=Picosynechococcus sp. PCC 73109 TaxID=374982 RepID=UPI00074591E4|nr:DUF6575 domain-containing protein [Picosynechococcus sp. PCC 73109]AMA08765.1 hypothetical protein AWQ23_05230 [Picosynechococcus sp. PCC 73109]
MSFLPTTTQLGELEILEVYVDYNGPRLLSCQNQAHKLFLGLWVDEEDDYDFWLFMPVSVARLREIHTGEILLRESFLNAETLHIYGLTYVSEDDEWECKTIKTHELDTECLPLEDAKLNFSDTSFSIILPKIKTSKNSIEALKHQREFLTLTFNQISSRFTHEFPMKDLGDILSNFQILLEELGVLQNTDPRFTNQDIRRRTKLNTRIFSPGSFQVEVASTTSELDLLGNSTAGNSIDSFLCLASYLDNKEKLLNSDYATKKVILKYKKFLSSLRDAETGIEIDWCSPTLNRGRKHQMSFEMASRIIESIQDVEILDEKEYVIVGQLFKIDTEHWKFGIRNIETNQDIKGKIMQSAYSDASSATISEYYTATILELPKLNASTNEIKKYYQLLELELYSSPSEQLNLIES